MYKTTIAAAANNLDTIAYSVSLNDAVYAIYENIDDIGVEVARVQQPDNAEPKAFLISARQYAWLTTPK